jgi:hypothetical protein
MYARLAELYEMFRLDCKVACDVCEAVKYVATSERIGGKGMSQPALARAGGHDRSLASKTAIDNDTTSPYLTIKPNLTLNASHAHSRASSQPCDHRIAIETRTRDISRGTQTMATSSSSIHSTQGVFLIKTIQP